MAKNSKWQLSTNLIANIASFVSALFISFYTTPYITKHVGMEAYGLIGLAQNFTSYITIITAALNSMASRFIVVELHKNNNDEANKFFNSALIANTLCAIMVLLLSVFMIPNLNFFINVSDHLLFDAKITFALTFLSFSLSLSTSVFNVVYNARNRLDLGAWRTVESNIIRVALLIITFMFIGVKIQYTVAVTLISSGYVILFSIYYKHKLLPEIHISYKNFEWQKIWTMVKAGVWNSISRLSHILLNGLDLWITNLFIGGALWDCISKQIAACGLQDIMILLGSQTNPYKYIKNCDIYVQTSIYEGICITVNEAMIFNKPIVSTNFPAIYEKITDGENGLIAEMNGESIAEAVQKLIENKSLWKKFSEHLINNPIDYEGQMKMLDELLDRN